MKKYGILFFVIFNIASNCIARQQTIIVDSDSIEYLYVINSDTITQINYGFFRPRFYEKRKRLLLKQNRAIDSTGLRFSKKPKIYSGELVGYFKDKTFGSLLLSINLQTGTISKVPIPRIVFSRTEFPLGLSSNGDALPTEVISTDQFGQIIGIFDFKNLLGRIEPPGFPEEILKVLLIENNILAETGYCDGGCYYYRYFIITRSGLTELKFDKFRKSQINDLSDESRYFRVEFYFSHEQFDFLMALVDYGNLPENTDLLFSKDLNDTTHILKKHKDWKIIGESIQNNKNQFFYLRSKLDNSEKVIVSYSISKGFESICYQVFKGNIANKKDLNNFSADQLKILKNLIFAKYNYAFEGEFYQAYFNLYAFYNEPDKLKSRTKEVNHLLTDADKENLKIINKELKKYEK